MPPTLKRECGSCTLCYKTMGIADLEPPKPAHQWCTHCAIGKGCKIYASRPESCQSFECLWLQGMVPEELRPDRSHIVFDTTTDGGKIVAHIDPLYPEAHENSATRRFINGLYERRIDVILVRGDRRTIIMGKGNKLPLPLKLLDGSLNEQ